MGDPVGPPSVRRELVWSFRELADANGHLAVFYEVSSENLPLYLDLGLALLKLGESARVRLEGFSLDGSLRKPLRYAQRRVEREGGRFEVVPPAGVPALLDELDAVSREWLDAKRTREKGFSLGYFDRAYLSRLPVALVRRDDRIVAFANLWLAGEREEVSVDLMRHVRDAPPGVMEYLFAELMLWSRDQGYAWFDLGMAPLSGLETRALAPLWSRLGAQVFRHGERFYNFRGLRAYKEKFDPVWEPIYLAAPGGIALPGVLRSVAALISGGLSGVVKR
jgi:phosphatidylglycerol lysyltransferase